MPKRRREVGAADAPPKWMVTTNPTQIHLRMKPSRAGCREDTATAVSTLRQGSRGAFHTLPRPFPHHRVSVVGWQVRLAIMSSVEAHTTEGTFTAMEVSFLLLLIFLSICFLRLYLPVFFYFLFQHIGGAFCSTRRRLQALRGAAKDGTRVAQGSFNALLHLIGDKGTLEHMLEAHGAMRAAGLSDSESSISLLVRALCEAGQCTEAWRRLQEELLYIINI